MLLNLDTLWLLKALEEGDIIAFQAAKTEAAVFCYIGGMKNDTATREKAYNNCDDGDDDFGMLG